jgi:hypothetical protein
VEVLVSVRVVVTDRVGVPVRVDVATAVADGGRRVFVAVAVRLAVLV